MRRNQVQLLNHWLRQLVEAIHRLALARDRESIIRVIATAARRLTDADASTFVLREGDQCFYADEDAVGPLWKGQRFPINACISGWVMMKRQPAVIEDIYADPRIPAKAYLPTFVKSLVMVPIRGQDPFGAIGNYWAHPHAATQDEVKLLQTLADATAIAMDNVRRFTEQSGRIHELHQTEQTMRMFSQKIMAAREEERKQVSSILHHDVGSLAVGVSAHLDAIEGDLRSAKPAAALKWLERTRKLFEESLMHLKELAVQLRPPELDALGLRAALRQHFSQVTRHGGARIHFRETLGRRRVHENTATILFRITQEALTNAITHGHATRVDVVLAASKKKIRLSVSDNGKGFDPLVRRRGKVFRLGLRVMQEMAVFAGGAATIDSKRGKGTTVRVSVPLRTMDLRPGHVMAQKETVTRGQALENLSRLRMNGFGLSIDDYGTGYSSMQQLTRIPFTELKIDQTFVTSAATHDAAKVILNSSLQLAKHLKIAAVAEGVETQQDWDLLRELDCDLAQGYFIARPMAGTAYRAWRSDLGSNPMTVAKP